MTLHKKAEEAAYALGNELSNAPWYLAKDRQFNNKDLEIFVRHLVAFAEEWAKEQTKTVYQDAMKDWYLKADKAMQMIVRNEALEECAKIVEDEDCFGVEDKLAKSIRALKTEAK